MFRDMVYIMSFFIQLDSDDFIFLKCLLFLAFSIHTKVPCNLFFVIALFGLFLKEKKFPLIFFSCLYAVDVCILCINMPTQNVGGSMCVCVYVWDVNPKTEVLEITLSCFFTLLTVIGSSNESQSLQI